MLFFGNLLLGQYHGIRFCAIVFHLQHRVHKEYGSHAHKHYASAENNRTMKYCIAKHLRVECILFL